MFTNIVAIGQFAWALYQGIMADDDEGDDGLRNNDNKDLNIEKGSKDLEEHNFPNFVKDVINMIDDINVMNSSNNCSSSWNKKATQQTTHKSE
jgi:hypothetical protein